MKNVLAISYAVRALEPDSREQKRMIELSTALDRHVMIVATRSDSPYPSEFHQGNLSIYGTHARTQLGVLWRGFWLGRQALAQHAAEPWTVSAQDPFQTSLIAYPLARLMRALFHVQVHGDNFANPHWEQASFTNRLWTRWGRFIVRRAAGVRVVSKRIERALLALKVQPDVLAVLPVRVELGHFLSAGSGRAANHSGTVRFLYAGRWTPEKNLPLLLAGWELFAKQNPAAELHLYGDGPLRSQLAAEISSRNIADTVTLHRWVEDAPALMAAHDVFVLTSDHEGYSLVLLEAAAAGMSLITTDVGCVGELVFDREEGIVVDHNPEAVKAAMEIQMDREVRSAMAAKGQAMAARIESSQAAYSAAWARSFGFAH